MIISYGILLCNNKSVFYHTYLLKYNGVYFVINVPLSLAVSRELLYNYKHKIKKGVRRK